MNTAWFEYSLAALANIIAGHLLITLLGNIGTLIPTFTVSFLVITQIMLIILQIAVSIIQAIYLLF